MNQLFVSLGIEAWKPWLTTLVMPPLPLLLLVLVGARLLPRRRGLGWSCVLLGLLGLWGQCTTALGLSLMDRLTRPPPALSTAQVASLGSAQVASPASAPHTVILVLGAGRRLLAPEYAGPDVSALTLARVRYGAWLARQTGLPLAYSGGVGHGSPDGPSEADIVRQVVERDFGVRLRWAEGRSRDTNENARLSVPLLRAEGITQIVLVTHGFHQQRALAAFGRALKQEGATMRLLPAPMGLPTGGSLELGDWLPSAEGLVLTRLALHEWLGWLAGA